ncbi:MAG: Txe/YoeB family addiction module toxin [Tannerella sp.]|nr:Txe/YoeB family addiction module toxin [Tannerella sp.]
MEVEYKQKAQEDRKYWKERQDIKIMKRISDLIEDICQHPFTGMGKPEPLRFELAGLWSRRINRKHRLVYEVFDGRISIISMKDHY